MLTGSKIGLYCILSIAIACSRPVNNNPPVDSLTTDHILKVIRNFKAEAMPPDFDTTLVSQYIRSIFQDSQGHLWFGTIREGVVRYDKKTLTYFSHPEGFNSSSVYAINEDKNGQLWFGTDQGVYRYDGQTFKNYREKEGLKHIDISRKSILVDRAGTLWVGTHGGVYRYDPEADRQGKPCFALFTLLPPLNVTGLMEDQAGNIWFASSDQGAFRYNGKKMVQFNDQAGLSDNYAGGIAQDHRGHIWFTMKNGICKFDGQTFTEFTAQDGLGGTEFWGILIEKSGIIWVTARGNTTRFDPSRPLSDPHTFTVFTPADGLNCCVQSMYQDRSGRLWWGTGQGLYSFDGHRFYQVKQQGPW